MPLGLRSEHGAGMHCKSLNTSGLIMILVNVLGQTIHANFAKIVRDGTHLGLVHVRCDAGDDDEPTGEAEVSASSVTFVVALLSYA